MKKWLISFPVICALVFTLTGCGCRHQWTAASCTQPETCTACQETRGEPLGHTWADAACETPQTCSVCGETQGEPLGHTWTDAACETPQACSVCGQTQGEPLGHTWTDAACETPKTCQTCGKTEGEALGHNIQWEVVSAATCTQEGERAGQCAVCGAPFTEAIPLLEHTPGDWQIVKVATIDAEGTRHKVCTMCGQEIETETYALTEEEKAALMEAQQNSQNTDTAPASDGGIVFITRTGKKYHYDSNCNGGNYFESTLAEAKAKGLKPCQKCVG